VTYLTSSIPRVKSAIVDLLTQQVYNGDDVRVVYGRPRDMEREQVIVGDTSLSDQHWAALGDRARQEDYEIELIVRVTTPGMSQKEATERAFEIFGTVELALRGLPALGVFGVSYAHISTPLLLEGVWDNQGYAAIINASIMVSARI
jgi:hypothetical protein